MLNNTEAAPQSNSSGAIDFSGKEQIEVEIDGKTYILENKENSAQQLSYSVENGVTKFFCSNFYIRAKDKSVSYNIDVAGANNSVYTGDMSDNVVFSLSGTLGSSNHLYVGAGDDTITSYSRDFVIYGEDGDDLFNIYNGGRCYGGSGNDAFNLISGNVYAYGGDGNDSFVVDSSNYSQSELYGENGDDDFLIKGTAVNSYVNGGAGSNTFTDLKGNVIAVNVDNANAMVESFARNETKVILIDGLRYEVTNGSDAGVDFVYRKNGDTVEFISNMFSIKALDNASYNVALKGMNQKYYASDAGDTISSTSGAKIYGGAGDDSISVRGGYGVVIVHAGGGNDNININVSINNLYVDGGDGDDTITTLSNNSYGNAHILGGNGNDTFNLSESSGGFVDGGDGDDVFNISGSLYTLAGGSGNNIINDTGTNNMYSNMSNADNTLTEIKFTSDNETKTINIGGIEYTIKNLVDGFGFYNNKEKAFTYGYNPATGEVVFGGCYFDITGESGKEHNISLYGSNNKLQTGTKNDTINIYGDANEIHAGSGDDTIIHNSSLTNTIYGEDGNDTIELNGRCGDLVSGGNGDDEITIRGQADNVRGDAGNDIYHILSSNIVVTDTEGSNEFDIEGSDNSITAGSGNDSFTISGDNNTVRGSGGDDYYVILGDGNTVDGGTGINYYVDLGNSNTFTNVSLDPNSNTIIFVAKNQTEEIMLDGKRYVFKNTNHDDSSPASNKVSYSYNPNTGELLIIGSDITLECEEDEENNIKLMGDNNIIQGGNQNDTITVESGSNNYIYGNAGNDTIISNGNNAIYGESGDDRITQNGSNGSTIISSGDGNDTLLINSDNNTNIQTGSGNNTTTITGSNNNLTTENGNNKITTNGNNNTITTGNGDNRFSIVGNENQITTGEGNKIIGIQGNNNTLTGQDGNNTINIIGGNNTITTGNGNTNTNVRGNENNLEYGTGNAEIEITGDDNTSKIQDGNKNIEIDGNNNSLTSGSGSGNIEINGNENEFETVDGNTEVDVKGDGNTINTGAGIDKIEIKGDNNIATSGEGDDEFQINKGDGNTIDGNEGYNTMINGGTNTKYTNVVDITPKPLNIRLQVGANSTDGINIKLEFNMFGFELDFGSAENAAENIEQIEEVLSEINTQRAQIGAMMNRLESASARNTTSIENLTSSRSTIMDADIAAESAAYVKNQILQQTSTSLLSSTQNLRRSLILNLLQ